MSEKKKRVQVRLHTFFEVKGNEMLRKRRDCPRCGKGVYMGLHSDRSTCGKCGFTEFNYKVKSKKV
jgi:small subunit ribosomal protein S27Ae